MNVVITPVQGHIIDGMYALQALRRRKAAARALLWLILAGLALDILGIHEPARWLLFLFCLLRAGAWTRDWVAYQAGFSEAWDLSMRMRATEVRK